MNNIFIYREIRKTKQVKIESTRGIRLAWQLMQNLSNSVVFVVDKSQHTVTLKNSTVFLFPFLTS